MLERFATPSLAPPQAGERRQSRSPHLIQALHHQMQYVQTRLGLEAIVLADELGQVLAWAGERDLCSRLGLEAPWLAATPESRRRESLAMLWDIYPGLDARRVHVRVVLTEPFAEPLALCAIGDSVYLAGWMDHVARGVRRIGATAPPQG
jgi:hypothetical protein